MPSRRCIRGTRAIADASSLEARPEAFRINVLQHSIHLSLVPCNRLMHHATHNMLRVILEILQLFLPEPCSNMLEAAPATEPLQVVDAQSDPLAVVSPQGAKEAEVFQEAVEATEEPPPTHKFEDDD